MAFLQGKCATEHNPIICIEHETWHAGCTIRQREITEVDKFRPREAHFQITRFIPRVFSLVRLTFGGAEACTMKYRWKLATLRPSGW